MLSKNNSVSVRELSMCGGIFLQRASLNFAIVLLSVTQDGGALTVRKNREIKFSKNSKCAHEYLLFTPAARFASRNLCVSSLLSRVKGRAPLSKATSHTFRSMSVPITAHAGGEVTE